MASQTYSQLKELVTNGGNIIINANEFSFVQIRELTSEAKQYDTTLIIRKTNFLTSLQCREMARLYPGKISFDFTC